ncbi:HK97 family phage prohead protease [Hyphomicrobium sp. MC1]|uniref:HK97 family phage prohead protease n=1 Tax=Hyphomicrobium sp. (strain MC1) TaxID=717785 RepID=UPI000213EB1E|nr:HK97 family phage prohead protease [Hyphomicrobium sp. MC1]CCB65385.1 phage prohead protease (modular protein) [Hyphomicrobium sp. MC1]
MTHKLCPLKSIARLEKRESPTAARKPTERRDLETRFLATTDQGVFEGHASIFGVQDSYGDVIKRGAFKACLKAFESAGRMPLMLYSHDPSRPVGVWEQIAEDEKGLHVQGRLLRDIPDGDLAYKLLMGKALDGLSIGFRVVDASRDTSGVRTISQIDLVEISLVSLPAMPGARIEQVRSSARTPSGHATAVADLITACKAASQSFNNPRK